MADQLAGKSPQSSLTAFRARIGRFVEAPRFVTFISIVIAINALVLGLETSPTVVDFAGPLLNVLDRLALVIFCIEIGLKLFAFGPRFFRSGWNVFDFAIVAIALMPAAGAFTVLRALRIFRALRLLSVVPQMRAVVGALLQALPGMGAIIAVLALVFYVAGVMATKLFGAAFPDWFGSVPASMYTLFQVMTLESWSMGIVRPVMDEFAWAWLFFVPFIIITSFAVLNLFIALIVNSMQAVQEAQTREDARKAEAEAHDEREVLLGEIRALQTQLKDVQAHLADLSPKLRQ